MGFSDASIFSKIALVVLPVGFLFIVIGLATNNWVAYDLGANVKFSSGLWKDCGAGKCIAATVIPDYYKATRALVILGMLAAVAGTCLMLVSIIKNDVKALKFAALIVAFAAGMIIIVPLQRLTTPAHDLLILVGRPKLATVIEVSSDIFVASFVHATVVLLGLLTFIGVGVYGGKYLDDTTPAVREVIKLSWSFALTTVGGIISVIAGVLWIISIATS